MAVVAHWLGDLQNHATSIERSLFVMVTNRHVAYNVRHAVIEGVSVRRTVQCIMARFPAEQGWRWMRMKEKDAEGGTAHAVAGKGRSYVSVSTDPEGRLCIQYTQRVGPSRFLALCRMYPEANQSGVQPDEPDALAKMREWLKS